MGFDPPCLQPSPVDPEKAQALAQQGFEMTLPYPVSNNQLHMPGAQGGIVLTTKARAYYNTICHLLSDRGLPPMTGRLSVSVLVFDPDARKRDINNLTKSLFDALELAGVFVDDEQIDETFIRRAPEYRRGGEVHVKIWEIAGAVEREPLKKKEKADRAIARVEKKVKLLEGEYGAETAEKLKLFQIRRPTFPTA